MNSLAKMTTLRKVEGPLCLPKFQHDYGHWKKSFERFLLNECFDQAIVISRFVKVAQFSRQRRQGLRKSSKFAPTEAKFWLWL